MSGSLDLDDQAIVQTDTEIDTPEHEEEVQTIVQSIQDPPSLETSLKLFVESDDKEEPRAEDEEGSYYWDAATMAPLNAASTAAIARLRAYKPPPFPLWDRLPLSRRAAVLMLLYADRRGDLRVVITMRAASLRSFSGHAALPGGKADSLDETPYQIARREAWEEIGLPLDDSKLPAPFRIEHLCYLPMNLARTELVVRPCVALLHTDSSSSSDNHNPSSSSSLARPTAEETLIPRLDAKEVAAVFSAPFHNFLKASDELPVTTTTTNNSPSPKKQQQQQQQQPLPPGKWYEGYWSDWHSEPWRVHFFYVPVTDQRVVKPRVREGGLAALDEDGGGSSTSSNGDSDDDDNTKGRYKVWGMTARILVDAATIAYGETPEFEHNRHFGDEKLIETLAERGVLEEKRKHRAPGSGLAGDGGGERKKVDVGVFDGVPAAEGDIVREGGAGKGVKGEASKM